MGVSTLIIHPYSTFVCCVGVGGGWLETPALSSQVQFTPVPYRNHGVPSVVPGSTIGCVLQWLWGCFSHWRDMNKVAMEMGGSWLGDWPKFFVSSCCTITMAPSRAECTSLLVTWGLAFCFDPWNRAEVIVPVFSQGLQRLRVSLLSSCSSAIILDVPQ